MQLDRYAKTVLTVIAAALVLIAVNPWLTTSPWLRAVAPRTADAQGPTPAPVPAGPATPIQMAPPSAIWWEQCTAISKETVPAAWGALVTAIPGAFIFVADDTIRLVRFAPYEITDRDPMQKPCKLLEIKRTK